MEREDEIAGKLDRILVKVGKIEVTQAVHGEQLKEHMRRTQINEEEIKRIDDEVKPVIDHITHLKGIKWFLGALVAILTIAVALTRLL